MSRNGHRITEFVWLGFAAAALLLKWGEVYVVGALILSAIHEVAADLLPKPSQEIE